ncbi:MAG TPA: MFS transporter [Thermoanaerobaculia bacterium]|nr:MFS transporter [Thermoanaerobaculia bacterium]
MSVAIATPARRLVNRNFLLLWQGQAVSQLGNQAFSLAMAFWVLEATGSASLMGLLPACTMLLTALLSPIGGALADRFPRIRILVVCDCIAGFAILLQAAAMLSGRLSTPALVALLFAVATVTGTVNGFFQPSLAAAIPDLVPAGRLGAANSLNQFSIQASQLIGMGVGGMLYPLLGAARLFLFDGLSFLFAAGSEALVQVPAQPVRERLGAAAGARQFVASIREGFAYVRRTPGLLPFIAAPASYNFATMAVLPLLPFFVKLNLHAGAEWYGLLLATISCGTIAGFLAAGLVRFTGEARARFLLVVIPLSPTPLLLAGFVHRPGLAVPVSFALGFMLGLINVNLLTLLQSSSPPELRGRVMGLWAALGNGVAPLGMALGGLAGDLTGKNIPLVFTACGALTLSVIAVTLGRRSTRRFLARA